MVQHFITVLSFAAFALLPGLALAKPTPQWVISEGIDAPESAYYDRMTNRVFISNVAGTPTEKDGKGWITVVTFSKAGNPAPRKLVEGLNAPKGIRKHGDVLWVADIDQLVKINAKSGKILERIAVPGATFLNDVAIDDKGKVYVSDTIASKIHVVDGKKVSVFAEGPDLESPNGLLVVDGKLYVASWGLITDPATFGAKTPGHLYALDLKSKEKTLITKAALGNLDGLEQDSNGDFLVSDWVAGKVYRVTKSGESKVIVDGIKNAADIGLMFELLLVPAMGGNEVLAYPK